jgi:hypothetical protein
VEAFEVNGPAMQGRHDDRQILGLAQFVLLVGDQSALFLSEAEEFGDGVIEEGLGHVLFVEGEVVLEVVAEGFFVLFIAFAGEAFDEPTVGEGFGGEAGEFGDGFAAGGDRDEMAAAVEEPHGDFETAEDAGASGIDGEEFRMEPTVVDEDR